MRWKLQTKWKLFDCSAVWWLMDEGGFTPLSSFQPININGKFMYVSFDGRWYSLTIYFTFWATSARWGVHCDRRRSEIGCFCGRDPSEKIHWDTIKLTVTVRILCHLGHFTSCWTQYQELLLQYRKKQDSISSACREWNKELPHREVTTTTDHNNCIKTRCCTVPVLLFYKPVKNYGRIRPNRTPRVLLHAVCTHSRSGNCGRFGTIQEVVEPRFAHYRLALLQRCGNPVSANSTIGCLLWNENQR